MRTIRNSVFETNSSTTHSLTMCLESDINDWKNGKRFYVKELEGFINVGEELDDYLSTQVIDSLYDYVDGKKVYKGVAYNWGDKSLYSKENLAEITQEQRDKWLGECDDEYYKPLSYDEYWDGIQYETFEESFVTPSGDKVIAFGYYGNDY